MSDATIDDFLGALPAEQRQAVDALRDVIRAVVPDATERLNYGVPAFLLDGRPLVSAGAARGHCSFYVQSPAVIDAFAGELRAAGFALTRGSVLFQPDRPLPADLVRRLVLARVDEVRARPPRRGGRASTDR
ncbi:MAG TPA: DUF1801 domain-containing protein [Candidatus Limnocylindria bacterium]